MNTSHGYPWRGFMMILVGITEGILIGADPGALFLCFFEKTPDL